MKKIEEKFINLIGDHKDKAKYADEVMGVLQKAYAKIGGIHGTGFKNKEDMIKNIPFWKINRKNGKIVSVAMYKDKAGRKGVAYATDGSEEGKAGLADTVKADMSRDRSFSELSGAALSFTKKAAGGHHMLRDKLIHPSRVKEFLDKDDEIRPVPYGDPEVARHPEFADHFYQRKIGDEWHTKLMLGTPGKKIKR